MTLILAGDTAHNPPRLLQPQQRQQLQLQLRRHLEHQHLVLVQLAVADLEVHQRRDRALRRHRARSLCCWLPDTLHKSPSLNLRSSHT